MNIRRYLKTLRTLNSIAPFVGLLGTAFGIMKAFYAIDRAGKAELPTVVPPILKYLGVTAAGLLVTVAAVIAWNFTVGKGGRKP